MLLKTILNGIYYSGMQTVCAPLTRGVGSILMLHHVRNEPDQEFAPNSHLSVSPEFLDIAIFRLKQDGYRFVSMDQMAKLLESGEASRSESQVIAITLDDGYRDNLVHAVPIFRRHEIPFTIYVSPGLTEAKDTLWWEDLEQIIRQRNKIDVDLPEGRHKFSTTTISEKDDAYRKLLEILVSRVSEDQQREIIAKLSAAYNHDAAAHVRNQVMTWRDLQHICKDPLCTIGAHTMGHYALARLPEKLAYEEMQNSRYLISKKIDQPVSHFAYPYGYPDAAGVREFEFARELGFRTAVTTRHGVIYSEHTQHLTALPRISLNGSYQSMRYLRTLISGVTTRISNKGGKLNVA
ncbi:MAG: polysaccharide deacetylase family protein [Rhizobiaceae bacterium]